MVQSSAKDLRLEQTKIYKELYIEKNIIFFTVLICLSLFIVIIILSKKMNLLNEKLHQFSYVDSLTNIENRRAFDEKFEIEWQRALREHSKLALLLIDIDSFKKINDIYGHSVGDACLIKIAKTLKSCLKRTTDIITRYGGEEFAIILPNTSEAMMVAEQCRQSIEALLCTPTHSKDITITIGIGVFKVTQELVKEDVIIKVDQALYRGKSVGKNRVEAATI